MREPRSIEGFTDFQCSLFHFWANLGTTVHEWKVIGCWCGPKYQQVGERWVLTHRAGDRMWIQL